VTTHEEGVFADGKYDGATLPGLDDRLRCDPGIECGDLTIDFYTALDPVYRLAGRQLTYEERLFGSNQREGSATRILPGMSKRITDLFSLRAGYIKEDIDANSIVFDADNNRFYLDLDYRLNQKNNIYATLEYLDGNLVTTARGGLGIDYEYWLVDDAFTDLSPLRWAYRLSGKALTLRTGDSFTINSQSALDGSILYYDSEADNYAGSKYTGLIYSISYLYRF
jgi:hypothetical protein